MCFNKPTSLADKEVSAYITSKQILHFAFVRIYKYYLHRSRNLEGLFYISCIDEGFYPNSGSYSDHILICLE